MSQINHDRHVVSLASDSSSEEDREEGDEERDRRAETTWPTVSVIFIVLLLDNQTLPPDGWQGGGASVGKLYNKRDCPKDIKRA